MKKRISSLLLVLGTTVALTLPTTAQAQGFQPRKFLTGLRDRIANGTQRLYLRAVPGDKDAKAVMKQSLVATDNVTSLNFNMTVDGSAMKAGESMGSFSFNMNGPMQSNGWYNLDDVKQQWNISGRVQVEGVQVSGAGEMIMDGQDMMYFRLTEIPAPLAQYQQLKNKWMSADLTATQTDQEEMTPEQQERLKQATHKLYEDTVVGNARKEKWEGINVFVIDQEYTTDDLMAYIKVIDSITAEQMENGQTMTSDQEEMMRKVLDAMAPFKSTTRIERSTFYMRQAEAPLKLNIREFAETMSGTEMTDAEFGATTPDEVEMKMSMTFDKYNEPVEITIPSDARPAEEVMQELMGYPGMMGGTAPSYGRPQELPEDLTEEQLELLQQYGY